MDLLLEHMEPLLDSHGPTYGHMDPMEPFAPLHTYDKKTQ